MGVSVSINHPAFPQDSVFGIDHLGEVPNGGTLEVPEENERTFITAKGMTIEDAFAGSQTTTVSGSSAVDDADEIIGDREPPGPEQGVSPKAEQNEDTGNGNGNGNSNTSEQTVVPFSSEEPPATEGS